MARRAVLVVIAAIVLVLFLAAAPQALGAVSFVDKQVQAGGLLIQNYINRYGMNNQFTFPDKSMVKKGGGLEDATKIWPSNPWTGKVMGPGTSRGTYTYALGPGGTSYTLTMHLSSGSWKFSGGMKPWLKSERNTESKQNLLLLQRYIEAYAAVNAGTYPTPDQVSSDVFRSAFTWPVSPWTGDAMAAGTTPGCYDYVGGGTSYTLKVMLTNGWWTTTLGPLHTLSVLSTSPGN